MSLELNKWLAINLFGISSATLGSYKPGMYDGDPSTFIVQDKDANAVICKNEDEDDIDDWCLVSNYSKSDYGMFEVIDALRELAKACKIETKFVFRLTTSNDGDYTANVELHESTLVGPWHSKKIVDVSVTCAKAPMAVAQVAKAALLQMGKDEV